MKKTIFAWLMVLFCPLLFANGVFASDAPRPQVMQLALKAYKNAVNKGLSSSPILTIIDYSLPSSVDRLWVFDVKRNQILFHTLVAHGKGSGENLATRFSNHSGTLASSLGVFLTKNTYIGKHGYSLKIKGLEKGFNENAESRTIVIHSASYVNHDFIRSYGRIGRSWGCPALEAKVAKPLIDTIKDRTVIVAYYPDHRWLQQSTFIN